MKDMLENKVLVNLYILSSGKSYEIFVPVNEKVGNITRLLNANLFNAVQSGKNCVLMNTEEGICYENNQIVRDTSIKNGTRLILI